MDLAAPLPFVYQKGIVGAKLTPKNSIFRGLNELQNTTIPIPPPSRRRNFWLN